MFTSHTRHKHVWGALVIALLLTACPWQGTNGIYVPDVVGLTRSNAEWTLVLVGLRSGDVTQAYNEAIPLGSIIDQDPTPARYVRSLTPVDLVVSLGPAPDLAVDPLRIELNQDSPAAIVTVRNDGVAPLSWTATTDDPSISLTPSGATGDSTDVTITAPDFTDTYTAQVTFTRDDDASDSATVTVEIARALIPNELIAVPAGPFEMGDPWGEGAGDELPVHTVTLSAYEIGEHEVTNQEYADMLNLADAQGYVTREGTRGQYVFAHGKHLITWRTDWYSDGRFVVQRNDSGYWPGHHPVSSVHWHGGAAYCNWLSEQEGLELCYDTTAEDWPCDLSKNGYHLPTEAQWERAAAWEDGYHWRYGCSSDAIDCSLVAFAPKGAQCDPLVRAWFGTWPVGGIRMDGIGTFDRLSPVGCTDMSGNVMEWCNDWYRETYYAISPAADPKGPAAGTYHVVRGGGDESWAGGCRTAKRKESGLYSYIGFRIAR